MHLLRDIPPLRSIPTTMDAALYNNVRLALLRIGNPLEVELQQLCIDMVLERTCWVGYHCQQISLPRIAWDGFDTDRSALDAPVGCTMHLYHNHSWLQMPSILLALGKEIQQQLAAN